MVIPIWTSAPEGPSRIPLRAREAQDAGLDHDSIVMCDYLTTVALARVRGGKAIGRVSPGVLKKVTRAVRIAIGDPSVETA